MNTAVELAAGKQGIVNTVAPPLEATNNKLAHILRELEEQAAAAGGYKYRALRNGLVLRVAQLGAGFECAIARKSPTRPSEVEERTVLAALAPTFAGSWHHYERRRAIDGAYYHVSVIDYHR